MSFKCYLYYDTETSVRPGLIEIKLSRKFSVHQRLVKPVNQGTSWVYLARVSERVFFVCFLLFVGLFFT